LGGLETVTFDDLCWCWRMMTRWRLLIAERISEHVDSQMLPIYTVDL